MPFLTSTPAAADAGLPPRLIILRRQSLSSSSFHVAIFFFRRHPLLPAERPSISLSSLAVFIADIVFISLLSLSICLFYCIVFHYSAVPQ